MFRIFCDDFYADEIMSWILLGGIVNEESLSRTDLKLKREVVLEKGCCWKVHLEVARSRRGVARDLAFGPGGVGNF